MATSQVILLEHVDSLGKIGEQVSVKQGYARNYLLPQGKALRATDDNIAYFESQKSAIEAENAKKRDAAKGESSSIEGKTVTLIRQASEGGQLYGSVAARDIADVASEVSGMNIGKSQVDLNQNFKMIGLFPVIIALHPEVKVEVTVNIARTEDEARIQQETGRALIAGEQQADEPAAEEEAASDSDDTVEGGDEASTEDTDEVAA